MTLSQLLPALRDLSRTDKWRAVHFLVEDLAQEEVGALRPDADYPIWSPLNAFDAGKTLSGVLSAVAAKSDARR